MGVRRLNEPMVSVCMTAYNHAKYIAEAIESVLAQQTDFAVELVIGDDLSADHTRRICEEYKRKFPDRIVLRFSETNLGMGSNFMETIALCRGKYIALLEGDDFWTNTHKLQKQVDFLAEHPEYAFCYHHAEVIQEGNIKNRILAMKKNQPAESTVVEILRRSIWSHLNTVVMRSSESAIRLPDWILNCPCPDWAFLALIAGDSKIRYFSDTMSVYRQHEGGLWSKQTEEMAALSHLKTGKILSRRLVKRSNMRHLYSAMINDASWLANHYRKANRTKSLWYSALKASLNFRLALVLRSEKVK